MSRLNRTVVITSFLLTITTSVAAQPVITGLNSTLLPRSGRVAITGTGFGSTGDVVIAGMSAWTSTWTDTRIVAYVPEAAPVGAAPLYVVAGGEQSNEVALIVTLRQPDGRVRWTFEADGTNLKYRPARAPDGTLYLHSNNNTDGIVYALSPDGGLLWVQQVEWVPAVPPMAGPDGTVYVGTLDRVNAFSAQGQLRWEFIDPGAQHIQGAPTIGPDGKLYSASDLGLGAFALDPTNGELQWSNTGDPFMYDFGTPYGYEVKFGPSQPGGEVDQLYVHMEGSGNGNGYVWAFGLDGEQRFIAPMGGIASHEPVVGSDGTIYCPFGTDGAWGLRAVDPENGVILWQKQPQVPNTMTELAIGPDDTIYYQASGRLEALNPHTQSHEWIDTNFDVIGWPSVSPDGTQLLVHGVPNYGDPGFIRCYDASNGSALWEVGLPGEPYPGFRVLGTHHPRITPDGATAYVSTFTVADGSTPVDPHSFLYAIDIGDGTGLTGDLDGDGVVGIQDFLILLAAWGPCPDPPAECAADLDGDGQVGVNDFLILLGNWG